MTDGVRITLTGDRDLVASFKELREYIKGDPIRRAVRAAATIMLEAIRQNAPIQTGKLRDNLTVRTRVTRETIRARVAVNTIGKADNQRNAFYWRFVEFGHKGPHGSGAGTSAHPFITPAYEATKTEAAQEVIDEVGRGIDRAGRRAARAG